VTSSWFLLFSYHNDARSNKHQTATGIVTRYVDYTNCCLYRVDPPDDEQQTCSKHVEA